MRFAKFLLLALARSQVGGKADGTDLFTALAVENRGRDQHRDFAAVLASQRALVAGDRSAALAHLTRYLSCLLLAGVEFARALTDHLVGPIAESHLGPLIG